MNILDTEEMAQAENLLLQTQTHQPYIFVPLEPSLVPALQLFSSSLLLPATRQIQEQAVRLVSSARNIKSVKKQDPNGCIRMFINSVFAIIFPVSTPTSKSQGETLKCSLYSKDLNFNNISNKHLAIDNLEAKAMMAKFFHSLIQRKQYSNAQKIRYIQWSFEKNQILQELFIVFYRIILAKLYVEGADDFCCPLNFSEAVTNLIEYFDISYRNFGELFLISEENHFLASVPSCFIMGEYMENEGNLNKQSTKTSDEKIIPVENASPKDKQQVNKKNGVYQKDIKLFNFILESGRSSHNANDKDADIQTPHFKDSHQFAFGKKRKDQEQIARQQELKKEFQKFFTNSEAESVESGEPYRTPIGQSLSLAGIPLKQSQQFENRPRNQTAEGQTSQKQASFLRKSIFNQSLIHELEDEVEDQPKINPETHHKNIVLVKDKNFATFSPQINNHLQYEGFSSFVNDTMFLDQEANLDLYKSSSGENAENIPPHFGQCKCVENRRKKNKIVSKVVLFTYIQAKTQRPPKFLHNLKASQNINNISTRLKVTPKETLNPKYLPNNQQFRKPSFLKKLKKDKQAHEKSYSSKSKSKKSIKDTHPPLFKDMSCQFELDKQTINRINDKCTAFSTILTKSQPKFLTTKSATKRNDSSSLTKQAPGKQSIIKNFDSKYLNQRPGLGSTWKLGQKYQYSPKNNEKQKKNQQGYIQTSRNDKVRVYAPVNIIAPTVYFNGITERSNRVIFTVNDGRDMEKELKMSERHIRTETCYIPTYDRLGNPQKKYF